jgi:hypothetical protein
MNVLVGLKQDAEDFVKYSKKAEPYTELNSSGYSWGAVGAPQLYEYTFSNGTIAREVVQTFDSLRIPEVFLCLEVDGERRFTWRGSEAKDFINFK